MFRQQLNPVCFSNQIWQSVWTLVTQLWSIVSPSKRSRSRRCVSAGSTDCRCLRRLSDLLDCSSVSLGLSLLSCVTQQDALTLHTSSQRVVWIRLANIHVFFLLSKFLKTNVCVPENGFELTVWIQSQLLHIVLLYAAIVPWWTVTHVQHTCGGKLLVEYLHESMVITIPMTGWEGGENNQSLLRLLPPKLTVSFYKALINVTTSFT